MARAKRVAILERTKTLTDAQIKALPSTHVELIPAPGTGKMVIPVFSIWTVDARGGAYANFSVNGSINIRTGGPGGQGIMLFDEERQDAFQDDTAVHILTFVTSQTRHAVSSQIYGAFFCDQVDLENQAILIGANNNIAGNFTGGHANNKLKVYLQYMVIKL